MLLENNEASPGYSEKKIDLLDGVRGCAIILVILYHYLGFEIGWIGVDLFFVLSGYLITATLVKTLSHRHYFTLFFIKRAFRILPLYYTFLFIFFVLIPAFFPSVITGSYAQLLKSQAGFWLFYCNWRYAVEGWPLNHTIIHFWSLACEVQFYLIWSMVVYFLYSKRKLFITAMVTFIIASIVFRITGGNLFNSSSVFRYVLLPSRLDAFSLGALLFVLINTSTALIRKRFFYIFARLVVFLIPAFWSVLFLEFSIDWTFENNFVSTVGYTLNSFFWCCTILMAFTNENFVQAIFKNKIIVRLGRYSYGMYIFHLPVWILLSKMPFLTGNMVFTSLISFCVTLCMGWFSFTFFESKIDDLKYKLLARQNL